MVTDAPLPQRGEFSVLRHIPTRWMDVDVYGHVNNVEYYSYFDTAVNGWLVETGLLDPETSPVFGVVAETQCQFLAELKFPEIIEAGISVTRLGSKSVTYRIALFKPGHADPAALGRFVHVYVDRVTRQSVPVPATVRAGLEPLIR